MSPIWSASDSSPVISVWLITLVVAVSLFLFARRSRPAVDQQGGSLQLSKPHNESPLITVATFNIQTGKSLAGKRDINRSAAVLARTDLAGVQEVYAPSWLNRLGLGKDQTTALMLGAGSAGLFCATRRRWFKQHRGNALLSKLLIKSWQTKMLPDRSGKSFRNMTVAKVHWQGEDFHFINTHLHTRSGRDDQLTVVLNEFSRYSRVILVGDFNCTADSPALAELLRNPGVEDAVANSGSDRTDPQRIDWILTKGFTVHTGSMVEKGISDHPAYLVSVSYS